MKKLSIKTRIIILFSLLFITVISFAQKETFDILDYTVSKDWVKQAAEGIRVFTKENKQTGSYCVISILKSKPSTGKIETDFYNAWQEIIITAYKGPSKPLSEGKADAEDGWKAMSGTEKVKVEGTEVIALLTVLSGQQRTFTIFSILNDQSYFNDIDTFLSGIDVNKVELTKANNIKIITPASNDSSGGKGKAGSAVQTFDNFIFQPPHGWSSTVNPQYVELSPGQVRAEEIFSIVLMKGKKSSASLQEELANCWDEFALMLGAEKLRDVNGGNYNTDEVSKTIAGWEYIAGHGSIRKANDFFVHAYIIRAKDRIERVVILSREIRLDAMRSNIDPTVHHTPYNNTITDFIFNNLRFANLPEKKLPVASWKGNGFTGVWSGIGYMGSQLKTTYAIFFSNGQVFYGSRFPLQGLYELDTYADKERVQRYWGTYTSQNGKGEITMPYGRFPIRLEAGKLVMSPIKEEHKFFKLPSVDHVKLNGTWMILGQENRPFTITFNADGTFNDRGALKVLDHTVYNYYSIADGGGIGNYTIKDHTIIFNYSDGRILKIAFPGNQFTPGNTSPKELVLSYNDDTLIKE